MILLLYLFMSALTVAGIIGMAWAAFADWSVWIIAPMFVIYYLGMIIASCVITDWIELRRMARRSRS